MTEDNLIVAEEDLPEKYALACIMLCDLVKAVDDENDEQVQALTPSDIDHSFTNMIADGESPVTLVKKFKSEEMAKGVH